MCPALLDGTKLPMSLQSLRISGRFPKTLEEMVFPGGLQDLTLGDGFQSCQGLKLPSGLKSLTFGRCFNSPIRDLLLPGSLERLQFGDYFDQSLEPPFALPTSLKSLSFGFDFDKPLDLVELPDSLQSLTLGQRFNQEVALVRWPRSLEHLAFGCNFSQNLTGVRLPENLKSLAFGHRFHQSLREVQLPEQLESLTFCDYGAATLGTERHFLTRSSISLELGRRSSELRKCVPSKPRRGSPSGRWPVQALLSGPGSGLEPKGPTLVFSPMPVLRIGCEQSVSGVG
ncbi:Probable serine/threonine-protein kinase fnkA (FNIP repeat-containing protein A) [Durusdinium trenchii]|uniref:Probable serine/threonine-protein kinase fnkA (FNIP repeat-containing protein A) n=1 Tax=Durusdinium trenchii TaxID=1381693 RepID=A0ABP0LI52_9DINO